MTDFITKYPFIQNISSFSRGESNPTITIKYKDGKEMVFVARSPNFEEIEVELIEVVETYQRQKKLERILNEKEES